MINISNEIRKSNKRKAQQPQNQKIKRRSAYSQFQHEKRNTWKEKYPNIDITPGTEGNKRYQKENSLEWRLMEPQEKTKFQKRANEYNANSEMRAHNPDFTFDTVISKGQFT